MSQERVPRADFGSITPVVWFLPAALLLIAIAPLPYGFYTLLRVVVCAAAAFLAWKHFAEQGGLGFWPVALGLVAVLFNPVIPIHLTREIWAPIDVGAAIVFGAHYVTRRSSLRKTTGA